MSAPNEKHCNPHNSFNRDYELEKMESLSKLAKVVVHDLNNHLAGILGNLSVSLRKLDKNHPIYPLLVASQGSAERGADFLKQLLILSTKTPKPYSNLIDLNLAVKDAVEKLCNCGFNSNTIELSLDEKIIYILGDLKKISRAIFNLTLNAKEAVGQHGLIKIFTSIQHIEHSESITNGINYAVVEVVDSGLGISPQNQTHIFEPFFTTKENCSRRCGLGLTEVWNIAHEHQGFVTVDSEENVGSRFGLFFPMTE